MNFRVRNINIFNDTLEKSKNCTPIVSQKVYKDVAVKPGHLVGTLTIETNNTIDVALNELNKSRDKVAILNFADFVSPGGWVKRGSSAQEECICRCNFMLCSEYE